MYASDILAHDRLDEFHTESAHFCVFYDDLPIHSSELLYRVQLLPSMCVFLKCFFFEGTALEYVLENLITG